MQNDLAKLATLVRYNILYATTSAGSGHPTSSLSAADLMTTLFFKYLSFDLDNPDNPANDRVIFSKGHASPLFYALYAAAGTITKDELGTLRDFTSPLEGHPTPRFKYTEAATGSLGQGLSVGVGMALALRARFKNQDLRIKNNKKLSTLPKVYVLMGDGEFAEGSVWEAIQLAAHYKLNNLVGILDVNRLAQSDATMYGHDVKGYAKRVGSFGWNTIVVDGHDIDEIDAAFAQVRRNSNGDPSTASRCTGSTSSLQANSKRAQDDTRDSKSLSHVSNNKPTMIIAKTIKGKGVSFIEDKDGWHGKALSDEQFEKAVRELKGLDENVKGIIAKPKTVILASGARPESDAGPASPAGRQASMTYKRGDEIATRKVYGEVLAELGKTHPEIVALDADTKNSTYAEIFKKAHPDRFFDMYIAEQNMVGAAQGMARLGLVPFVSTFACFLTRAFDQIRMGAISSSNIKFVGSHAGVSIGPDGSSQMGLEDFAMFRAVHGSTVLHPSDAVSAARLLHKMVDCDGIAYMRTSRPATPVIYGNTENFTIGGSKVFKSEIRNQKSERNSNSQNSKFKTEDVTIIGVGVTLHEALKAQKQLKNDGIAARVIDCYSIKPIDEVTLRKTAAETKALIVVEDHWFDGGLGDAVLNVFSHAKHPPIYKLAVTQMPHSGKPEELLDWAGISASKIVEKVKEIL